MVPGPPDALVGGYVPLEGTCTCPSNHPPFFVFPSLSPVLPEDEDTDDEEGSEEEEEEEEEMGEDWDSDSDVEEVFPVQNAWANPRKRGTTG